MHNTVTKSSLHHHKCHKQCTLLFIFNWSTSKQRAPERLPRVQRLIKSSLSGRRPSSTVMLALTMDALTPCYLRVQQPLPELLHLPEKSHGQQELHTNYCSTEQWNCWWLYHHLHQVPPHSHKQLLIQTFNKNKGNQIAVLCYRSDCI